MTLRTPLRSLSSFTCVFVALAACSGQPASRGEAIGAPASLKEAYADYFPVGAAVSPRRLRSADTALLIRHVNSVVAESAMKYDHLVDEAGDFTFGDGDEIVAFARRHGMAVRGHTLTWYNQTRDAFYQDSLGNDLDAERLLRRLRTYIHAVLDHYRGQIYCWDVVNEALSDEPDRFYRDDIKWFEIAGPDYIAAAFRYAHEADSTVKLFYNDYDLIAPAKREKAYRMLEGLLEDGVPVHGVGLQGHYVTADSVAKYLPLAIDRFASLGLEVQITELDVSVYPYYHNIDRATIPNETRPYTPAVADSLAATYRDVFRVLRDKRDVVTGVTLWGIADDKTWLSNYVVKGRYDYPLLFDRDHQPKKAYHEVVDFAE